MMPWFKCRVLFLMFFIACLDGVSGTSDTRFFHLKALKNARSVASKNTYVCVSLRDRMCRPTHTYVWAYTYVRVKCRVCMHEMRLHVCRVDRLGSG